MLCDELAKLTSPAGLEEMSKYQQFEYKIPVLPPMEVASVPGTSTTSSSLQQGSNLLAKLMGEFD